MLTNANGEVETDQTAQKQFSSDSLGGKRMQAFCFTIIK